jgi:hypothetical protein
MLTRTDTSPENGSATSESNVLPERELSVEAVMKAASAILWPEPGHEQPAPFDDMNETHSREMFSETEIEAFTLLARAQKHNREGT